MQQFKYFFASPAAKRCILNLRRGQLVGTGGCGRRLTVQRSQICLKTVVKKVPIVLDTYKTTKQIQPTVHLS